MSGGRGSGLVLLGLSGLLLVVALRSAWSGSSRLADPGDRGRSAGEVARQFVLAAGDFDYREGTGYHSRLLGLTTGPLHEALRAARIDPEAIASERQMQAQVSSAVVTERGPSRAIVRVAARVERRWRTGGVERSEHLRQEFECRLLRQGGLWLVSEIRLLGQVPLGTRAGGE